MRYEQPIPFYMAYPFLLPLDQEQAQEKDLQVMKSFYSRRAARIQEKVDRECDRMEYDGSMMFDEYPDKFMMEHLCRKIEQEVLKEEEGNTSVLIIEETCQGGQGSCGNRREEEGLRDLIGVILFNEMFRRRSRHRRQKRFY
ncbi:hypothetical protein C6W64_012630 [Blautia sp. SG-772]|nr:hypothetical protein C6W64_012630 [Blautia sp. SG-772]